MQKKKFSFAFWLINFNLCNFSMSFYQQHIEIVKAWSELTPRWPGFKGKWYLFKMFAWSDDHGPHLYCRSAHKTNAIYGSLMATNICKDWFIITWCVDRVKMH